MRRISLSIIVCMLFAAVTAHAQCVPDPQYADSLAGVYPLPVTAATPNAGINKPACITKPFSFVFTVKVSDTIAVNSPLGLIRLPLDSVLIARTGAIDSLPAGITYTCNPPSCGWKKKTTGCVLLSGTPTAINQIRTYNLKISGKAFTYLTPAGYDLTFPGILAEGQYSIKVLAANNALCQGVSTSDLAEINAFDAVPNPTNGKTIFHLESSISDKFVFSITNLMGQRIETRQLNITEGANVFEFDASNLPNGIYIYTLSKGSQLRSNKLIVNH